MTHARSRDPRALGWVLLAGGALMVLFWILYLSGLVDLGQHDPVIAAFESAFVLADTALGLFLLVAGWKLLRRRPSGPYLMVIAAAMSLYLGLLDLAFYAGVGLYSSLSAAAVFELSLNATCVVGGTACLFYGWRAFAPRAHDQTRGVLPIQPGFDRRSRRRMPDDRRWIGGAA